MTSLGLPWTGGEALCGFCACVPVPVACSDVIVLISLSPFGLFRRWPPENEGVRDVLIPPRYVEWLMRAKALSVERFPNEASIIPAPRYHQPLVPRTDSLGPAAQSFETPVGRPITMHGRKTDLKHGGRPRPNQRFPTQRSRRGRVGWRFGDSALADVLALSYRVGYGRWSLLSGRSVA